MGIFRTKSLKRLSDPEELDQLFKVTSSKSWIGMAIIVVLLALILLWSIFGAVYVQVGGQGILIHRNQAIYDAVTKKAGWVTEMLIEPGQDVKKDQLIARIDIKEERQSLLNAEHELETLMLKYQKLKSFIIQDNELLKTHHSEHRANLEKSKKKTTEFLEFVKDSLNAHKKALNEEIVTEMDLANIVKEFNATNNKIDQLNQEISSSNLDELRTIQQNKEKILNLEHQILKKKNEITLLKTQIKLNGEVRSPADGYVLQIMSKKRSFAKANQVIAEIEGHSSRLEALVYIPASKSMLIKKDMKSQITLHGFSKEEYGSIQGSVKYVSLFPASRRMMLSQINNNQLIDEFTKAGPLISVVIRLDQDDKTYSGYRWSSSSGPSHKIRNGTLVSADVIVREQAPITLVLPALKRFFGVAG